MNPFTALFLILATLLVMAAVMILPLDADTYWRGPSVTVCKTGCD